MIPKTTDDWMMRTGISPTVSVESWGRRSPRSTPTKPYVAETATMPAVRYPTGRRIARTAPEERPAGRPRLAWLIGPIDAAIAMLHAVNVPASPDTNAKSSPAAVPAIAVSLASWPSSVLATLSPIVESTNSYDHSTASARPARTLNTMMRPECLLPVRGGGVRTADVAVIGTYLGLVRRRKSPRMLET
jgi:hypothetical protein